MQYASGYNSRDGARRGFTLLEILLVTIVLAAIIGISIPNFSPTLKRMTLKQTANDLAYLMRYAQSRAVTYNTVVRLVFNSDQSSYWLKQRINEEEIKENESPGEFDGTVSDISHPGDDLFGNSEDGFSRIKGRYGRIYNVSSLISIEAEELEISFYPDGSIDKRQFSLCDEKYCYSISTQERRGYVYVYGYEKDA